VSTPSPDDENAPLPHRRVTLGLPLEADELAALTAAHRPYRTLMSRTRWLKRIVRLGCAAVARDPALLVTPADDSEPR